MLDRCLKEIERCPKDLLFSKSAKDLDCSEGKINAFIGIEGGSSINEDLSILKKFYDQGGSRMGRIGVILALVLLVVGAVWAEQTLNPVDFGTPNTTGEGGGIDPYL